MTQKDFQKGLAQVLTPFWNAKKNYYRGDIIEIAPGAPASTSLCEELVAYLSASKVKYAMQEFSVSNNKSTYFSILSVSYCLDKNSFLMTIPIDIESDNGKKISVVKVKNRKF